MIATEARPTEVTGRQTSRGEPVSVSTGAIPSSFFQGRGTSVNPFGIHPDSSVEIMPSLDVPEQSSIAGPTGAELAFSSVLPTPVSSSSSSKKLDYLGDDDIDWDDVHPAPNTSKYSHLTEEEMQIAAPRIEPQSGET